ncbi:MAG: tetratricopeptide repeat protein [Prosthecobacter sp.]|uniref:tetratricopeptide repeat protein n=1 Tax=Prosthecobacter sp. TaxID=1965333 RepID=UPI0039028F17
MATLLMALCAGLYAWTADFPMVFDDHAYLTQNPVFLDVKSFGYPAHFEQFANSPAKAGNDPDLAVNFILRPVAYASFYLNYLMDGFKPRWFRVVNIVIHALNSLLIYALLNSLLRRSAAGDLKRGSVLFIAATAALIFAAHPLAIESVTYIIQRFTSLAVLFSLLALWLHFTSLSARSRLGLWLLRSAAVVAMLLAMQTKEESFTVPFLAVLLDWLVVGSRLRLAVVRALPLLLCAPLIPALVILTAAAQHGGAFNWEASINIVNDRHTPLNHWHYIVTELTVVAHYLRQLFWPAGLNLDPAWPKYESLWQGPVLVALGVLTGLIAAAWCLFRRFRGDVRFALGFAFTLWFFITVSPSSGLVPLPDLMAEHRSYLPSIGIFVLVACLLDRLRSANLRSSWAKVLVPAAAVLCVGALSWATCARNKVWSTRESLWEDTVAKSPGKYRTWGNLGAVYSAGGNEEKAVACFRAALKIEPRFQNGLLNLSNSLLRLNRPKESLDTTQQLIQMDQTAATKLPVAFTLGIGLAGVGRYDEAITTFTNILAAVPDNIQARKALGLVYLQTGLPQRALAHFQAAAGIQPADAQLQAFIKAAENAMAANTGSAAARLRLQ